MGKLDKIEQSISRIVNKTFAKTFRSQIQPVELFGALKNEMDVRAAVYSHSRVLVPSRYTIKVSPADHRHLKELGPELLKELTELLKAHAASQNYYYSNDLSIALLEDDKLTKGMSVAEAASQSALWRPFLQVGDKRYPVGPPLIIGRSSQADIRISDPAASRRHARISWDGQQALIEDLGSTNGFKIDGYRRKKAQLRNNSLIVIGEEQLLFMLIPVEDT